MLDLKFIGKGSAFNTKIGNNSSYIRQNENLFLIDCGGNIFTHLQEHDEIIKGVKKVYILITHMHPDHVGSLGDFIFYNFFINNGLITSIIYPEPEKLETFLEIQGVKRPYYTLNEECPEIIKEIQTYMIHNQNFDLWIIPKKVKHMDNINSFGYFISNTDESIFYSGDTCEIFEEAYTLLENNTIDKIYQDTCLANYPNNVHTNINVLNEYMKNSKNKHKIYCMHWDTNDLLPIIKSFGFEKV